jgi:hypothetical protein
MLADLVLLAISHPFVSGVLVGAVGISAPAATIGWCSGHNHCVRAMWRQLDAENQAHGDVPNVPGRAA